MAGLKVKRVHYRSSITFEKSGLHGEVHGTAVVSGDSFTSDLTWTFAAQHCSGTMQMRGATANGGTAVIGELEYFDASSSDDKRTKPGTFAVWKGERRVTRIER